MIATTFHGESVYLLPYRPDWSSGPVGRFTVLTDAVRSLQGRESRQAYGQTLRTQFDFSLLLYAVEQVEFRLALQRLENKRVLCPFWPAAAAYGAGTFAYTDSSGAFYTDSSGATYVSTSGESSALFTGIWLTFEPDLLDRLLAGESVGTCYEVHETDAPVSFTPTAAAVRVPLMLGVLADDPDPVPDTSVLLSCPIKFRESSPAGYALRCAAVAESAGPTLDTGITPKLFPLSPNWTRGRKAGAATVEITRNTIGHGRELAETYYPQKSSRLFTAGFSGYDWTELRELFRFFQNRQGPVEGFWLEGICDEMQLTAASSSASATISVDRTASLGDNRYIAIISPDGTRVHRRVSSVGTGTLTLDSSPGVFPAGSRIVALVLARFAKPELVLAFSTDRIADADIAFIETPEEYSHQTDETIGTTIGALLCKAALFRFFQKFPGGDLVHRFTSYERDVIADGETWAARPIDHGDITDTLDVEKTKVSLRARAFTGNPLMLFVPFRLEVPLWCEILECVPDASGVAGATTQRFLGRVGNPQFKGPEITAEVTHLLQDLNDPVPTLLIQPTCNYRIYSQPCGLSESAWTFTGAVVSVSGSTITVNSIARTAGVPALPVGYFAYGRLWHGSGTSYASRTIYGSTAISGGAVTLSLSHAFDTPPTGTLNFSPGCSGSVDDCKNKFNNYARFGGFPFVPSGNPSLVPIKQNPTTGGKK